MNDFAKLESLLKEKYASPSKSEDIWANESYKSLPQSTGAHVAKGHLILKRTWENDKTIILLSSETIKNLGIMNKITYTGKQFLQVDTAKNTEGL